MLCCRTWKRPLKFRSETTTLNHFQISAHNVTTDATTRRASNSIVFKCWYSPAYHSRSDGWHSQSHAGQSIFFNVENTSNHVVVNRLVTLLVDLTITIPRDPTGQSPVSCKHLDLKNALECSTHGFTNVLSVLSSVLVNLYNTLKLVGIITSEACLIDWNKQRWHFLSISTRWRDQWHLRPCLMSQRSQILALSSSVSSTECSVNWKEKGDDSSKKGNNQFKKTFLRHYQKNTIQQIKGRHGVEWHLWGDISAILWWKEHPSRTFWTTDV